VLNSHVTLILHTHLAREHVRSMARGLRVCLPTFTQRLGPVPSSPRSVPMNGGPSYTPANPWGSLAGLVARWITFREGRAERDGGAIRTGQRCVRRSGWCLMRPVNRQPAYTTSMPTSKALPPVVKALLRWRTDKGLSQAEAAQILQAAGLAVSVRTLQNWEGGRNAPYALATAALNQFLQKQAGGSK
jgi:DNA-binding transcriptional regulator YiaG